MRFGVVTKLKEKHKLIKSNKVSSRKLPVSFCSKHGFRGKHWSNLLPEP